LARILYIVAQEEPLLCGYLKAKVEPRSPEGHAVEIKLDERRGERRQGSRGHVPERRRRDRRRRPGLDDELRSRGFTSIVVEDEEERAAPARGPAVEPAVGWRPRSTRWQRTARSWRRRRARRLIRGIALLIVLGLLLVVGRAMTRTVNPSRTVAPATAPSETRVSEKGTAAVSPPAASTRTPRVTAAPPPSSSAAGSQEPPVPVAAPGRASGVVVSVDPGARTLVMEDMGATAAEPRRLRIRLAPNASVLLSERDPATADTRHPFTDTAISLSDIRPGDFIVVDTREQRGQPLARSVIVTLRAGRGSPR
jgi:hypothetical protein